MKGWEMQRPLRILLIEDNPADVRLTKEAFREGGCLTDLSVVEDGVEAMAFLRREGRYASAPRPDLILLDLNLPKKDGREVLAEIKSDRALARTPVIVLTSSRADRDICRAYELGANCYVTKPIDLEQFLQVVRAVQDFWLAVAELPGE